MIGGSNLKELGHYAWNAYYGWVQDQYGYSWQLQLGQAKQIQQQKILPNLLFCGIRQNQCSQALQYYQKIFPDFQRHQLTRYTSGELKGQIQNSSFSINHLKLIAKDSPDTHIFDFNEAVSFVIPCKTQQEIDYYWNYFTVMDRTQLIRIITNLVKNAIQAIPEEQENKAVLVSVNAEEDNVIIAVKDNGIGINTENTERIFEPKFTTKTSGMGLGLGIIKNIIENYKGTITFESELGKGSTFIVSLPIVK